MFMKVVYYGIRRIPPHSEIFMRANKKLIILTALCLILTVFLSIYLIGCNSLLTNSPKKQQSQTPTSFVTLDINPSIEFVLDQNGVVMSVAGANHDGKVLLFEEDGIVGATLEAAINNITALAIEYGYLTNENGNIGVSVVSDDSSLLQCVEDNIQAACNSLNFDISICQNIDLALEEELASLKAKYPNNANILSMDISRLRLAKSALQSGENIEDVCALPLDTLLARVNEIQSDALSKFDLSYTSLVEKTQYLFDSAYCVLENGLRVIYYSENLNGLFDFGGLQKVHTAIEYTMAKASKLTLEYFRNCIDVSALGTEYSLTKEQALSIAKSLDVTYDEFILKTHASVQDGAIVIEKCDITSYINTLYRNSSSASEIKDAYSSICTILDDVMQNASNSADAITLLLDGLSETTFGSSILTAFEDNISALLNEFIPSDVNLSDKNSIDNAIDDLSDTISQLEKDIASYQDESEFSAYCANNDLTKKLSSIRNELTTELSNIKQAAIDALRLEKSNRAK